MKWEEFKQLLAGLNSETPLGRIVSIRSEMNPEILKHFTTEQKRIRDEWQRKRAQSVSAEDMEKVLNSFKRAFISMAGGGRH